MKSLIITLFALEGVFAFPSVLNTLQDRSTTVGQSGCTTSKLCDKYIPISNAQIGYNPKNPTPAQKLSQARNQCGALTPCTFFDADEQYVSTTGKHAYASPLPNQIRGPCPGLNAAANHGYLARSGVQTITGTIAGLGAAYGMSIDLAGFLAAYAVAFDGDVASLTWSIGGPQSVDSVLTSGQGISWSHNKYEGDTSIGRCDAYINGGDAHSLSTTRFGYAYASGQPEDSYTFDTFDHAMAANTLRSIQTNPYYFTGLFSTTLVAPAAYNFVIAMMSNHTADNPGGYLNGAIFKEFFAISGEYPHFKWNKGQERIPDNWYRRPSLEPYTAHTGVFGDLLAEFVAYPDTFRFGGNLGKTNTYTGIDLSSFTNGAYSANTILEGDNLACFLYQNIQQGQPDVFNANPLTTAATKLLEPYLDAAYGGLTCPQLAKFNDNNLPPYPGRSYSPDPPPDAPENC